MRVSVEVDLKKLSNGVKINKPIQLCVDIH